MRWTFLASASAQSVKKEYQSCHVESLSRLPHPQSSASGSLGRFQLTPPHIALVSLAVASTAAAFTVVAFTVVATTVVYALEWRSASVLPLSVLLQLALLLRVLITPPVITALPPRSVVHTATIIMLPTTVAYPRHSRWAAHQHIPNLNDLPQHSRQCPTVAMIAK